MGRGTQIQVYKDKWLSQLPSMQVMSPNLLGNDTRVVDLITTSWQWNINLIRGNFIQEDADYGNTSGVN